MIIILLDLYMYSLAADISLYPPQCFSLSSAEDDIISRDADLSSWMPPLGQISTKRDNPKFWLSAKHQSLKKQ